MTEFTLIVGLFIGIVIGAGTVFGTQYVLNLQNEVFNLRRDLNVELCANWQNIEHNYIVRKREL